MFTLMSKGQKDSDSAPVKVSSIIRTPKNLKIIHAWVNTGHFCKGYEN